MSGKYNSYLSYKYTMPFNTYDLLDFFKFTKETCSIFLNNSAMIVL